MVHVHPLFEMHIDAVAQILQHCRSNEWEIYLLIHHSFDVMILGKMHPDACINMYKLCSMIDYD